jgi:hypothetical protein
MRGMFSVKPPPVMWADTGQELLDVDLGRGQERVADGDGGRLVPWCGRVEGQVRESDNLPDEGETIGVRTRSG